MQDSRQNMMLITEQEKLVPQVSQNEESTLQNLRKGM